VAYRGPASARIAGQFSVVQGWAGTVVMWRCYVSASATGNSAYWAGGGQQRYFVERPITALLAAPRGIPREAQLPAGQVMAGELTISTQQPLGVSDQIVWGGVVYRVEGVPFPVTMGGTVWYRTVLRRGDATG
jgi:hypothetical protein